MKEVKAYVCSYCDNVLSKDPNFVIEHEKRCFKNPNRKICSCLRCVHGKKSSYEDRDRWGNPVTKNFAKCTIDAKFEDFSLYCESFEEKQE